MISRFNLLPVLFLVLSQLFLTAQLAQAQFGLEEAVPAEKPATTAEPATTTEPATKDASSETQTEETGSEDEIKVITFPFTTVPTFFGQVVKVTEAGEVHLKTSPITYPEDKKAPVLKPETDFLAITTPGKVEPGQHPVMKILKAKFKSLSEENQAVFQIAPENLEHLKAEKHVIAIRPAELTDEDFQSVPEFSNVVYQGQPALTLEAKRVQESQTNLARIAQAFTQYQAKNSAYPPSALNGPDGKRWHSWRVLLLPFLGEQELYDEYNFAEPWDSEANQKLLSKIPKVYQNPYATEADSPLTLSAVITGKETMFEPVDFDGTKEGAKKAKGRTLDSIEDNLNQVMVGGLISPKANIKWTEPKDLPVEQFAGIDEESGLFAPLANEYWKDKFTLVMIASGNLQYFKAGLKADDFEGLITINGGESGLQEIMQRMYPQQVVRNNNQMKFVPYLVFYPDAEDHIAGYYQKQVPLEEEN